MLASSDISYVIYLYHRCVHLSPLKLGVWFPVIPRCTRYNYAW